MNMVLLLILLMFVSAALTTKPKNQNADPSSLGDINVPTAEAGRIVPVIAGTCKLSSPNVGWYGDFGTTPIYKTGDNVGGPCCGCCGISPGDFSAVVAYRYYLGMDLALCCGAIDEFLGLFIGDKLIWSGSRKPPADGSAGLLQINSPDFMGGDEGGGGFIADINIYFGTLNQPVDAYLREQTGCATAYPGVCHVTSPGRSRGKGYMGTSASLSTWEFVIKRLPHLLQKAKNSGVDHQSESSISNIDGNANPVEFIYECLVDNFWGMGMSMEDINTQSFIDAATTIKAENVGVSIIFDSMTTADEMINDLKRYINATVYPSPGDGQIYIKLIRNDYTASELPVLSPKNIVDIKMTRLGWYESVNELKVNYTERKMVPTDTYADGTVRPEQYAFVTQVAPAIDLANYFIQDETLLTNTINMPGLSNLAIATTAATKQLTMVSNPFSRLEITTNRDCYDMYPGCAFMVNWEPYKFRNRVFRVVDIDYGELVDSEIKIAAVEDIYGLADTTHGTTTSGTTTPGTTGWAPVLANALPILYARLEEVPYMSWKTERAIVSLISRPNKHTDRYKVYAKLATGDTYAYTTENGSYMPYAKLISSYSADTDSVDEIGFRIRGITDCDSLVSISAADLLNAGRNGVLINNEMLAWRDVVAEANNVYLIKGVVRGVADTVPANHNANSDVWIISLNPGRNSLSQAVGANLIQSTAVFATSSSLIAPPVGRLTTDATVSVKLLPGAVGGYLGMASAFETSITTRSRAWRPLPPGRIRVNDIQHPSSITLRNATYDTYGAIITAAVPLTIAWAHRAKLYQQTRTQDDVSDTKESGVTYSLDIYFNGALITTLSNITDDFKTLAIADLTALGISLPGYFKFELYSLNSGTECWQRQSRSFILNQI